MADRKISDLTALTAPASGDYLPIVDISEAAAASKNKRITIEELFRGVPSGTAAAPSIAIEGDEDTGVYSTGANELAISTGGTGRLFVDASGRVGVGATPAAANFEASQSGTASASDVLRIYNRTDGTSTGYLGLPKFGSTASAYGPYSANNVGINAVFTQLNIGTETAHALAAYTNNTERLRITSAGLVGIGVSAPSCALQVNGSSTVSSQVNVAAQIGPNVTSDLLIGSINGNAPFIASQGAYPLQLRTNNAVALTVDSSQRVGIGTTSPAVPLDVVGQIRVTDSTVDLRLLPLNASNVAIVGTVSNHSLPIFTNNTERARIDSSGRVLVGTSTALGTTGRLLEVTNNIAISTYLNNAFAYELTFNKSRGASNGTIVQNGDAIGNIAWRADDGADTDSRAAQISAFVDGTPGLNDMPGRLVFSTTADGASSPTERMRINNSGGLKISNSGTYAAATGAGNEISNDANAVNCDIYSSNASFTQTVLGTSAARNTTNNSYFFIDCSVRGVAFRFRVADSGNCTNANNSYTGISDIKLKENIVDAGSQWSDLKSLQVRKYNFKEKTGQPTHTQIGLIAQEVELVSPGLVSEFPDRDEDGNDLGTVTKSVNYSVLYMKAVKALQEAMERIETLEAKVAALEGA